MSAPQNLDNPGPLNRDQMVSALFGNLVMQQASMATVLLGKTPNPQTGKPMVDLQAARMFISHLEMLEIKTRGNLSKEEDQILKGTLTNLRLAYVEVMEKTPAAPPAPAS